MAHVVTDKEGTIKIDAIREAKHSLILSCDPSVYKLLMIINADLMTDEAREVLLKTLEEPPQRTIIFLTAEVRSLMSQTVISRCQSIYVSASDTILSSDILDTRVRELTTLVSDDTFSKMLFAHELAEDEGSGERVQTWIVLLRELLRRKCSGVETALYEHTGLSVLEKKLSCAMLVSALEDILKTQDALSHNVHKRVAFECLMLRTLVPEMVSNKSS